MSEPGSYYGMSVLKPPTWEEREIAGYLFLGGLGGASSILAAVADLGRRPSLAGRSRLAASAAISLSLAALIKDLGRPTRFVNMLRVFKPTSPMNVGSWLLSAYAPLSFAASASTLSGRAPRTGRLAGLGAAGLGALVSTYTGALISDTAVPVWHEGHREMPFLFSGSSALAAGGLGMITAPRAENAPAWRMALIGAGGELAVERLLERRLGPTARALKVGDAERRLRAAKALTSVGTVVATLGARRHRAVAAATGGVLLVASGLTRFGLFAAGSESARDPSYAVQSQKRRPQERVS